jgi:hypothetical protein
VDAAHGRQSDAVQSRAQSVFNHDLHDLEGNEKRKMDVLCIASPGWNGLPALFSRGADLAVGVRVMTVQNTGSAAEW